MKHVINITSIVVFIILIPFTYIANKIQDSLDGLDRRYEPEEPPIRHIKKKTVYPDGMYHECTTEDFNKWSNYIHKQLN